MKKIIAIAAVLALSACSSGSEGGSVAATVAPAPVESEVDPTTTPAPTTTTEVTTTTTTTTTPAPEWADDPSIERFVEDVSTFLDDTALQSYAMADAMGDMDVDRATDISIELWTMFLGAPVAPDGFPAKPEYDAWVEASTDAMDLISDGLIYMDIPKMEEGTDRLNEATALLDDFTDRLVEITEELS